MKTKLFLVVILTVVIIGITGCNSIEDLASEPTNVPQDVELTRLCNSIDSLQNEYLTSNTRVDWEKWSKRGFFYAVDGVVTLLFAEAGLYAPVIGTFGSWLYEDYFNYMVDRCNTMNSPIRKITRGEISPLNTVIFPVENATYVDSVGYYHNLIIAEVQSNGKSYISENGDINFMSYYKDVLDSARNHGIHCDNPINTKLLFQYVESIIKPLAELEVSNQKEIDSNLILSIFFNERYKGFNYDNAKTIQHKNICDKIIYNCVFVRDNQLVEYGTKVNDLIVGSKIDDDSKNNFKIANNIAINSSLRRVYE